MQRFRRIRMVLIIALLMALPASSWAGGFYLSEVSNADVGLSSAGSAARALDASTVFTNPAGMTRFDRPEVLLGIQPIYIKLEFEENSDTSESNRFLPDGSGADNGDASGWLPAGSTFYVHPVTKNVSLGIGVLGFFGLGLEYEDDWVGRYYLKEITLQGLTVMPSVAYRVNEWLSVGAGLNAMYGILDQKVAINNNPLGVGTFPDGELEVDDEIWGFGGLFGVLVEARKGTRFGLTYMTKTELEFESETDFSGLRPGLETILNNNGLLDAKLDLTLNAPQAVMFSAWHEVTDRMAVMGNIGWQDWSDFGKVDVTLSAEDARSLTVDRDYKDTWHAAGGIQYEVSEPWLLSFGIAYDSSMMDDEDRTPDTPVGETWKFGAGTQYKVKNNINLGLSYEFLRGGDLPMDVERGPLAGRVAGEYSNVQMHFINVAINWKL